MKVVVVGAGHNGLVCGCYLARAGHEVLILEQADRPGGGARTEETVPGYRFDTHSVAHSIINMSPIPRELDLAGAGLEYREMDPFAVALPRPSARDSGPRECCLEADPIARRAIASRARR